jgi:N-terminal domain of (some) glycogen debranching enzymes
VSDRRGDIEASATDPTGLFSFDTRFLSKWVLTVNGQRLNSLSVEDLHYFEARFFLVPGTGTVYVDDPDPFQNATANPPLSAGSGGCTACSAVTLTANRSSSAAACWSSASLCRTLPDRYPAPRSGGRTPGH